MAGQAKGWMAATALGLGLGLAALGVGSGPAAAQDIGSATKAFNIVLGAAGPGAPQQQIVPGAGVQLGERVDTAARSAATFLFRDDTELSLGAGSEATFDRFAYDRKSGASSLTITLVKGVFGFATGAVDKAAYTIRTKSVTIGGHGAVFEVLVEPDGTTTVTVDDGEVMLSAGNRVVTLAQGYAVSILPGSAPLKPSPVVAIAPRILAMNRLLTEVDPVLPGMSAADRVAVDSQRSLTTVSGLRVPPSRAAALAGALNGTSDGLRALQAWMDAAGGQPEGVSARAIDLIKALQTGRYGRSIDALGASGDRISKAAQASLDASYILRAGVAPGFVLSGERQGFLFGPKTTPKLAHFTLVSPGSAHIAGSAIHAFLRPGLPPLMGNGLAGVVNFSTPLEDGHYRLILWTNAAGGAQDQWLPFGQALVINGTPYRLAALGADQWPGQAVLGGKMAVGGFAGAAIVTTDISGGILNMNFGAASHTFLAALIIEPAGKPSLLETSGAAAGVVAGHDLLSPRRLNAVAAVDAALGNLLTGFITTADPGTGPGANPGLGTAPGTVPGAGPGLAPIVRSPAGAG